MPILGTVASGISLGPDDYIGLTTMGPVYNLGWATVRGDVIVLNAMDTATSLRYIMYIDNGVISWQKQIAMTTPAYGSRTAISANGNVISAGDNNGQTQAFLLILNNSGTRQVENRYTTAGGTQFSCVITDASNNIFTGGSSNSSERAVITKFNSSASIQWTSNYTVFNYSGSYVGLALDSSGNVYGAGYIHGGYEGILTKLNSSGTPQWYRTIRGNATPTSGDASFSDVEVSSGGDVYACGGYRATTGSGARPVLVKYNSSGTLQWQREFAAGTSSNNYYEEIAFDASENIYGVWGNYVSKYNSSGTLQWQRKFTNATIQLSSITISGTQMVIGGKIDGYSSIFVLPTDGTKTGSYTVGAYTVVYGAGTGTEQAGSVLTTLTSLSSGTTSWTTTASTNTISNTSFTLTKVTV